MTRRLDITPERPLSAAETAAWVDASVPDDARTVTIIGAGLGEALASLAARPIEVRALVFEPDRRIAEALAGHADWSEWRQTRRLVVLSGPDYAGAAEVARTFGDLQTAPVLVYPPLERARPDAVDAARRALQQVAFEASANEGARRASAGRYLLQTLANAPRLAREGDTGALVDLCPRVPAIVVAAGPSLDRNIHDLSPVRDRAVVIACDTAARPLVTVGIDPDFIVATDASRANAGHLSSLPPSESWLVAEGSLHPSAFTQFDRKAFIFKVANHEPWPWLEAAGLRCATLNTWGSVATSAFSLAVAMKCDPIIFAGADFAFTGGRPYCRGTSFEPLWSTWVAAAGGYESIWKTLIERWPEIVAEDMHGQPVRTARHLISFRDWIVERAAPRDGRRIINATGAGLLVGPGIEQNTASEALWPLPPIDRDALHRRIRHIHNSTAGDLAHILRATAGVLCDESTDVEDAWAAFADRSISNDAMRAALRSPEFLSWSIGLNDGRVLQGATL